LVEGQEHGGQSQVQQGRVTADRLFGSSRSRQVASSTRKYPEISYKDTDHRQAALLPRSTNQGDFHSAAKGLGSGLDFSSLVGGPKVSGTRLPQQGLLHSMPMSHWWLHCVRHPAAWKLMGKRWLSLCLLPGMLVTNIAMPDKAYFALGVVSRLAGLGLEKQASNGREFYRPICNDIGESPWEWLVVCMSEKLFEAMPLSWCSCIRLGSAGFFFPNFQSKWEVLPWLGHG